MAVTLSYCRVAVSFSNLPGMWLLKLGTGDSSEMLVYFCLTAWRHIIFTRKETGNYGRTKELLVDQKEIKNKTERRKPRSHGVCLLNRLRLHTFPTSICSNAPRSVL